jgi:hypothetical protein
VGNLVAAAEVVGEHCAVAGNRGDSLGKASDRPVQRLTHGGGDGDGSDTRCHDLGVRRGLSATHAQRKRRVRSAAPPR